MERHLRGNSPSWVVVTVVTIKAREHSTAALPPARLLTPVVLPQFTIPTRDSTKLHPGISPGELLDAAQPLDTQHQHSTCPSPSKPIHGLRRGQAASPALLLPVGAAWPEGAPQLVSSQALNPDSLINGGLVERSHLPSTGCCPPSLLQVHAAFFQALSAPCTFSAVKHPRLFFS